MGFLRDLCAFVVNGDFKSDSLSRFMLAMVDDGALVGLASSPRSKISGPTVVLNLLIIISY